MGIGKKELIETLTAGVARLQEMNSRIQDQALQALLEEQKRKLAQITGEQKTLRCEGCGTVKTMTLRIYEFVKTRWFTCSHGSLFCPGCLTKENRTARQARKAEKKGQGKGK